MCGGQVVSSLPSLHYGASLDPSDKATCSLPCTQMAEGATVAPSLSTGGPQWHHPLAFLPVLGLVVLAKDRCFSLISGAQELTPVQWMYV